MGIKIIKNPKGTFARKFGADSRAIKYVDITYRKRSRLGRILSFEKTKRIPIPKGNRITSIKNNDPRVGSVSISFTKLPSSNLKKIRGKK